MAIYRAKSLIDAYRARAKYGHINDLSGRTGMPNLTRDISSHVVKELNMQPDDILVDIGCGDGCLLHMAYEAGVNPWVGRLVGVLPTFEEIKKVQDYFLENQYAEGGVIFTQGTTGGTSLPNEFASKVVSNGVFLLLDDELQVEKSLAEMHRITKLGGLVFIGELPDSDESASYSFNEATPEDNLLVRIFKVLKLGGIKEIFNRFKNRLAITFSSDVIIISPKAPFWIRPDDFVKKMENHGFQLLKYYKCENHQNSYLKADSALVETSFRWNYIAIRG